MSLNRRLKKSSRFADLTSFDDDDDDSGGSSRSLSGAERSSHVTFCDRPTFVVLDPGKRISTSGFSEQVFRNPYGPPLYFHFR